MSEQETKPKEEAAKRLTFQEEDPVVTHHTMVAGDGKTLAYTVTTGRMPVRDEFGNIEAQVFYMAYTLKDARPEERKLMFSFNGGPGSPSLWLHLGALGPKRIPMLNDGELPPPPYALVDNPHTWLEHTDLVFIDPVGTGYSQAVDEKAAEKFWSVTGDIESVSEFIRLYLTRFERYASPLYLVGESYGTTRAAGISKYLLERGVAFNGVVLVSSAMSFLTLDFMHQSVTPYILFLPTYAATAWYHQALPGRTGRRRGLKPFLREVEEFANGEYAQALLLGDRLPAARRRKVVQALHRFTGLDEGYLERVNLKIEIMSFCKELLRDRKRTVGRLDSRITGFDSRPDGSKIEHDPSMSALMPPYTMAFNDYVRRELGYKSDLPYHIFYGIKKPWTWDLPKDEVTDTSHALRDAMLRNPHMKVFVASGYYDLATPYFATEFTLAQLELEPALRANIRTFEYEAGHMMYTHEESLRRLHAEIGEFLASA